MAKRIRMNGKIISTPSLEQYNTETSKWEPFVADVDGTGIITLEFFQSNLFEEMVPGQNIGDFIIIEPELDREWVRYTTVVFQIFYREPGEFTNTISKQFTFNVPVMFQFGTEPENLPAEIEYDVDLYEMNDTKITFNVARQSDGVSGFDMYVTLPNEDCAVSGIYGTGKRIIDIEDYMRP